MALKYDGDIKSSKGRKFSIIAVVMYLITFCCMILTWVMSSIGMKGGVIPIVIALASIIGGTIFSIIAVCTRPPKKSENLKKQEKESEKLSYFILGVVIGLLLAH